jgi:putative sigma-54 modulation protein
VRILISGRHVGVTEAMKDYAREKATKLERIHDRLTKVEVTLDVVRDSHVVEFVVDAPRGRLVGKAESPDMYAAVDMAEEKLVRQLVKHKQRLADHHRREVAIDGATPGPHPTAAPPPGGPQRAGAGGGEDTYEDVIERLGEE